MPNETTIRADAIAGLLVDWTGPIRWHDGDDFGDGAIMPDGLIVFVSPHTRLAESVINDDDSIPVELDCLRPEVQARVGSVLAARGTPIHHILDAARTNAMSNQHVAEAVAWSVRSVARGGEVLHKVYLDIAALRRDYLRDTAAEAIVAALGAGNGYIDGGALVLPGGES